MLMMHWLRTYSKCLKLKVKPHKITSMIIPLLKRDTSVFNLNHSSHSATTSQMYTFGRTIFATKKMRYAEVSVALCGGLCSSDSCMIVQKFQH